MSRAANPNPQTPLPPQLPLAQQPLLSSSLPTLRQRLAQVHLRLTLFALTLAAASLLVSGVLVIRNYAQRNLDLIASTVSYTVEPAIVFGDHAGVREGMVSVAGVSAVDRVEVRDPAGRVLAEWQPPREGLRSWLETAANEALWPDPSKQVVKHSGAVIGEVRVYGNSQGILRYAFSGAIIALACLGLTMVATRILAQRLQRDVIEPLDQLARVSHSVRSERAFHRRLPPSGIAEIDNFGRDFNALLAELEGWHHGMTSENAELARRATHDPLTGLGNRVLFEQTLSEAIAESVHAGSSFAVLFLDADNFKQINDSHGHEAGDAALVGVGERLRSAIRHGDQAFRIGGDEFLILLPSLHNLSHVDGVKSRIEQAMQRPFALPGGELAIMRLSIGQATYPDDGLSLQDLLRRADREMYLDKHNRRSGGQEGDPYA